MASMEREGKWRESGQYPWKREVADRACEPVAVEQHWGAVVRLLGDCTGVVLGVRR